MSDKVDVIYLEELISSILHLQKNFLKDVIIAYEPIWSIGTGVIPSNDEIKKVTDYIKKYVKDNYQFDIKVLYGGSVNNSCIKTLEEIDNIDGYLVGGCSLKCSEFEKLINSIQ